MPDPLNQAPPMRPVRRRGVVAVVVSPSGEFLVVRRSQQIAAAGMYCFPGGGIEPGESEPRAIGREFMEELGAVFLPQRRIWRCETAWNVDLAWWFGSIAPGATLRADPSEVESSHWLTIDALQKLPNLLESNHEFLRNVTAGRITL